MKKYLLFILLVVTAPVFGQSDRDLYDLCKVWGFMKYHHPAIMAGKYDMDQELFDMLNRLKTVENSKQRNELFSDWVAKFGPMTTEEKHIIDDLANFRQIPDFRWIDRKVFGKKLARQLTDMKNARRPDTSYYVGADPSRNDLFFTNEKSYDVDFSNNHYAMLGLFRLWNAIEYFFPYKYLNDHNWNDVLIKFIPRFRKTESRLEYIAEVEKFSTYVNDSHVGLEYTGPFANEFLNFYTILQNRQFSSFLPLQTIYQNGQVIVKDYNYGYDEKCGLKRGDAILKFDGQSVVEKINFLLKFEAVSNPESGYETKTFGDKMFLTKKDSVEVECLRNDSIISVWAKPGRLIRDQHTLAYQFLSDSILYVDMSLITPEQVSNLFPTKSIGLILDMRKYSWIPGAMFMIGQYVVPELKQFAKGSAGSIQNPGYFKIDTIDLSQYPEPYKNQYYNKPVVLLVSGSTISRMEYTTMYFQSAPNVMVIGTPTAGADGTVSQIPMPGNFYIRFTGWGVYYPDSGETQRMGVRLDELVRPTIKGLREGRDELLERAEEIIDTAHKTK